VGAGGSFGLSGPGPRLGLKWSVLFVLEKAKEVRSSEESVKQSYLAVQSSCVLS
jgi:hypothetical protein